MDQSIASRPARAALVFGVSPSAFSANGAVSPCTMSEKATTAKAEMRNVVAMRQIRGQRQRERESQRAAPPRLVRMDVSHRRREADHQSDLNRRPRAHVMQGGVEEKAACRAGTGNGRDL